MSILLGEYPQFNNLHTVTQALGLAVLGNRIYYLSTACPGVSCKSIWSSLVSNRGTVDCQPWGADLIGAGNLKTIYQSLPHSNYQHMASLYKGTNFLIAADPKAAQCCDELDIEQVEERRQLLAQHLPAILSRFAGYLNTHTNVPVLQAWSAELWQVGLAAGGVTALDVYGDCLGAWVVNEAHDWLGTVQSLLQEKRLLFPTVS